jgi:hypothetical protein
MRNGGRSLTNLGRRAAAQLLRLVPGSNALRIRRDLRDAAWLREADAVVISFPKSGRTFVRAMIARLYQRRFGLDERMLLEFPALRHASSGVPRVLFTHAGDAMRRPDEIRAEASAYRHAKLVLIARHPGDIAVSRYHHLKHRSRDSARRRLAEQPLDAFIWAEEGGIPSIVAFLNRFAAIPGITIIRYEDFLSNPANALGALARAIGLQVGDDDISDAVDFGSLSNLRRLERENYFTSSRLRRTRSGDEQSGKVRKGTSGGYRSQLGATAAARIDQYVADHLDARFGYAGSGIT